MYRFLFAFLYHYYNRFKDGAPRASAIIGLSLLQGLHIFCILAITFRLFNLENDVVELLREQNPIWYGLAPIVSIWILDFVYFNKERSSRIIERYKQEDILNFKNGIFVFGLLLVGPILITIFLAPEVS